jgi:hypothetical protein
VGVGVGRDALAGGAATAALGGWDTAKGAGVLALGFILIPFLPT